MADQLWPDICNVEGGLRRGKPPQTAEARGDPHNGNPRKHGQQRRGKSSFALFSAFHLMLPSDLVVHCFALDKSLDSSRQAPLTPSRSQIAVKIASLYAERLMSDLILEVGGRELPAHRLILCASSDVFQVGTWLGNLWGKGFYHEM